MQRASLLTLFLVVLIDLMGFGLVIPILPYYAQEYGATGWTLGWLMTSYSLMQLIFAPFWGRMSDLFGRRQVLLITIFGTSVTLCGMGFANDLTTLFAMRILAGFFGANISTAYAYVSDITTEENRAKGMGLIGAAFGLGFILGPAMGGILSKYWGYSGPMFAGSALALLNFFVAYFVLAEPYRSVEDRRASRRKKASLASIKETLSNPLTGIPIALFFLLTLAISQLEVTFAFYMKAIYRLDAFETGFLLAGMGFLMALIQGGLIGSLAKRFGEKQLILFGSIIGAAGLFGFVATEIFYISVFALGAFAIGHAIIQPSLSSLTSLGAPSDKRGMTMGIHHSASAFARVIGPLIAGWLYDQRAAQAPYWASSIILLLMSLLVIIWLFKIPERIASKSAEPDLDRA
jgi:MFS transporter, DHA1 family, tetracycline resistance protein